MMKTGGDGEKRDQEGEPMIEPGVKTDNRMCFNLILNIFMSTTQTQLGNR